MELCQGCCIFVLCWIQKTFLILMQCYSFPINRIRGWQKGQVNFITHSNCHRESGLNSGSWEMCWEGMSLCSTPGTLNWDKCLKALRLYCEYVNCFTISKRHFLWDVCAFLHAHWTGEWSQAKWMVVLEVLGAGSVHPSPAEGRRQWLLPHSCSWVLLRGGVLASPGK